MTLPTKLRPLEPSQFWLPTNIDTPGIKMIPQYTFTMNSGEYVLPVFLL